MAPYNFEIDEAAHERDQDEYAKLSNSLKIVSAVFFIFSILMNTTLLTFVGLIFFSMSLILDALKSHFSIPVENFWDAILLGLVALSVWYTVNKKGINALVDTSVGMILSTGLSLFIVKTIVDRTKIGGGKK